MIRELSLARRLQNQVQGLGSCEHRAVSKEGLIICRKIVEGETEVSPEVCRTCPLKAVNCAHLCFSLRQITPSPLIVRFNGRTEIWNDDPPELRFEQAACAVKVTPIEHPKQCAGCALRQPLQRPAEQTVHPQQRRVAVGGKVVAFPSREAVAATG